MTFTKYPSLAGRVVFITGGGSGIGEAIVEAFVANQAKVAFVDILEAESLALTARLKKIGSEPLFLKCDLTDIAALRAAIVRVHTMLGPIGALINNAGNDKRQPTDTVSPEEWDWSQQLNLKHQFFAAQAVRPQMKELGGGSIINLSSIAWMGGGPGMVAYTAAKAGVSGMTTSLAREFGGDNIRVNAIAPGAVITERQKQLWVTPADIEMFKARQCLHRELTAIDIARAALFLASDDSSMMTKQCLIVDGGIR